MYDITGIPEFWRRFESENMDILIPLLTGSLPSHTSACSREITTQMKSLHMERQQQYIIIVLRLIPVYQQRPENEKIYFGRMTMALMKPCGTDRVLCY